jgi:predicted 3-demethylubiquinone-9 3-methyltransferase (glyoxalase superfamily)
VPRITPNLWFDTEAEEAAEFYVSIFPNSRILERVPNSGGTPAPDVEFITIVFELDGQKLVAINGGPHFKFTEAISLEIECESQEQVDYYWSRLTEGGEEGPCGWLKDRYGLSWQVVPRRLVELLSHEDPEIRRRAIDAMMKMKKIEVAAIEEAVGQPA